MTLIRNIRSVAATFALALVAACAPATMEGVRQAPAAHRTFVVEQPYQQVYRTVVGNARRCWQTGMLTAQMVVTGDLYTDIRTGQISVALHGSVGVDTYLGIDIKALDDNRTQVDAFAGVSSWASGTDLVGRWIIEGSTACK